MYLSKDVLLKKMQHYCAYQDRCQFEAEQKLQQLGATEDQTGEIMVDLIQEGFLNEERFARSFARGKFNNQQWSIPKIQMQLRMKQISEPLIKLALQEIDPEGYQETIRRELQKTHALKKDIFKSIQSLAQKGFEMELIYRAAEDLGLKEK